MKSLFALLASLLVATVVVAPGRALADPLTPAQSSAVQQATREYFKAALSGDPMKWIKVTAPHYEVIGVNGKPIGQMDLANALARIGLSSRNISGNVGVDSGTVAGGVVTATVTVKGYANSPVGGNPGAGGGTRTTVYSQHTLTFVNGTPPRNPWVVTKDVVLKAHRQM